MLNIKSLYEIFQISNGITTDSRNCSSGSIFFALRGESFNGNAYAAMALSSGCSYAVIDDVDYMVSNDDRYIFVENVLKALQQLAHHHREQMVIKVIAITGTNGKTTTKELLAGVLQQSYNVLYTLGNLNNHIGVPLTLLRITASHDIAVIEMGANHEDEIKELCEIADPDYGIITNVGKAHLEGFGSFSGVVRAKGELYDYLRKKDDSVVFINKDNHYLVNMSDGLSLISYGTDNDSYINGKITGNSPYLELEWKAGRNGLIQHVNTHLIGDYNFTNVLAAITTGYFLGIENELINKAIYNYMPQNNRSQLMKTDFNTLIIDAYNANPSSMAVAIENFIKMDVPHKMVILGDMKELGRDSIAEHEKIITLINEADFEKVILVGENFMSVNKKYSSYENVNTLIEYLLQHKPQGKTILIKGSNSTRLSTVVDYL